MISPRFHSAAFLVHQSGLWEAIRMACRHFSFFCVSTQFVMLCVSIFHHLLKRFSLCVQSNFSSSSWLAVLCASSSNEILLSWSYSSFVLSSSCASSLISSSRMPFLPNSFLCLNDETNHSALGSAEQIFVIFRCIPCSRTVCYCWRDKSVE